MDGLQDEFFGTDSQQNMLRKGRATYDLLSTDPRLTYYGRTVGIIRPGPDTDKTFDSLICLQGACTYANVKEAGTPALIDALTARGYNVTHFIKWAGGTSTLKAAAHILDQHKLPSDIKVLTIDTNAPAAHLSKLSKIALSCGVLPLAGSVLRGNLKPGLALVAVDDAGTPVSCSAAAGFAHPDDPECGNQSWWGMLATDKERRGQHLALILGAMAIQMMHERFGFSEFMTGVQAGNAASENVCAKTGLSPSSISVLTVVDPKAVAGGKFTS